LKRRQFVRLFDTAQGRVPPAALCWQSIESCDRNIFMMDVVVLAVGFAFFALSIAYVYACDLL